MQCITKSRPQVTKEIYSNKFNLKSPKSSRKQQHKSNIIATVKAEGLELHKNQVTEVTHYHKPKKKAKASSIEMSRASVTNRIHFFFKTKYLNLNNYSSRIITCSTTWQPTECSRPKQPHNRSQQLLDTNKV